MMADFGITCESRLKSQVLLRLYNWLLDRYRAGETAVLIVDEAQNLPDEVLEEIREGLAHYTATVITASSPQDAASKAILQLADFAKRESLTRDFGYASGSAYGILLDAWSPGWTRQVKGPEDLGERLRVAGGIAAAGLDSRETAERAALRYDSTSLRKAEEKRDAEQKAKVAELRKRFVDRPVLVLPNAGGSFSSSGITPIPGAGTVFPKVHVTAAWGVLEPTKSSGRTTGAT